MPKYRGKEWTKVGRAAQTNEQLKELGKLIEEKAEGTITAFLTDPSEPLVVVADDEDKAYRITADGKTTRVAKPKVEVEAEVEVATA